MDGSQSLSSPLADLPVDSALRRSWQTLLNTFSYRAQDPVQVQSSQVAYIYSACKMYFNSIFIQRVKKTSRYFMNILFFHLLFLFLFTLMICSERLTWNWCKEKLNLTTFSLLQWTDHQTTVSSVNHQKTGDKRAVQVSLVWLPTFTKAKHGACRNKIYKIRLQ